MATREMTLREIVPYVEQARQHEGWALAYANATELAPAPSWDYEARARELLRDAKRVLDLGTGGGEVFERLLAGFTVEATATETYAPNVPVAAARLANRSVPVIQTTADELPFPDASFDLVLSRHTSLDPAEVARVLAPSGGVLTQQVGRLQWRELAEFFPRMVDFGPHFERYRDGFANAGLTIKRSETHDWPVAFRNLGEVAYMLVAVPFFVPNFDPIADLDALLALQSAQGTADGIVLTESRYVIEARKA
jgi:SAM-dependent methyltransferase